jgi:hypothetical protein
MNKTKPSIDALFYGKEEIDKELKCPVCSEKFVSPRLLPCGDSICLRCIQFLKIQNSDLYKCPACADIQSIQAHTLPKIKTLENLLNKDANEVYRNRDVEILKENLANINLKTEKLESNFLFPNETIKEHCKHLLDQVDLATEKAHKLIDDFRHTFCNQVKKYEKECLDHFESLKKSQNQVKLSEDLQSTEKVILEAKEFFQKKIAYLKRFKINDEEIKQSLLDYDQLISKVKDHSSLLKSHLFKTNKMKFVENTRHIKIDLVGKLEMHPISIKTITSSAPILCYNNPISTHKVLGVEVLNDNYLVSFSIGTNSFELNKLGVTGIVQTNNNGIRDYQKSYFETLHKEDITLKSIISKGEIILIVKYLNKSFYCYDYQILIFDSNLSKTYERKLSNINNVVSIAENESKYYCLLTSKSNVNFLSVYDLNLSHIATKGLEAQKKTDAFYFSANATQLRVSNGLIFILEIEAIKVMNEKNGIVMKQFPVVGWSFELLQDRIVLFDHQNTLTIYDSSGKKLKTVVLQDEFKKCDLKFFSNLNVIGFNQITQKIIVSKITLQ